MRLLHLFIHLFIFFLHGFSHKGLNHNEFGNSASHVMVYIKGVKLIFVVTVSLSAVMNFVKADKCWIVSTNDINGGRQIGG